MKKILIILFLFATTYLSAQKYFTKTGFTEFKASVEAFEPVEAQNNSTTAVLNVENGEVAALLFVRAFHFKLALMEEHFNENYMDSDKFPKANFKGKIEDFDINNLNSTETEYKITGTLTVKGISKPLESVAKIKFDDNKIFVESEFTVQPEEFGIEIPSIVRKKVAENVVINYKYELVEKN